MTREFAPDEITTEAACVRGVSNESVCVWHSSRGVGEKANGDESFAHIVLVVLVWWCGIDNGSVCRKARYSGDVLSARATGPSGHALFDSLGSWYILI